MKFSKKILTESLNQPKSEKKVFTEGRKQNVILSEEQLDRLLIRLEETKQNSINTIIKECHQLIRESIKNEGLDLNVEDYSYDLLGEGFDTGGYNRGVAAANGIENIINGVKKAYDMIKDSDTRKRLANSITKLGNFMTITADAIASGRDQRAPRPSDSLRDPLPYPELETVTVDDEEKMLDEQEEDVYIIKKEDIPEESHNCVTLEEGGVRNLIGTEREETYAFCKYADKDGNKLPIGNKTFSGYATHYISIEDCCKMAPQMGLTMDEQKQKEHNDKLIQEDIKKMKQIIKPITKI